MALTDDAHQLIKDFFRLKKKVCAVDATCGNGHDTEFLARLGFTNVFGFDVQEIAIQNTQQRINNARLKNVELILDGHQNIERHIKQPIDCAMFNFGYLPTGDKNITTDASSSIHALNATIRLLNKEGLISMMCYPGHPSGHTEAQAIREWFKQLGSSCLIETHLAISPKPTAPTLYLLKKI